MKFIESDGGLDSHCGDRGVLLSYLRAWEKLPRESYQTLQYSNATVKQLLILLGCHVSSYLAHPIVSGA